MGRSPWMGLLLLLLCGGAAAESPAERLAQALRFPTVSHQDAAALDARAFEDLRAYLARSYPRVHAALKREIVGGYSLLFTWRGREPQLAPLLLTGHLDVVPVAPGSLSAWSHPPFAGVIADGFVWGRGALDDKVAVLGLLEASEELLAQGFQPRRTVYLAFGHDEEVGGDAGARAITDLLESRGVRLWFTLDEGMAIMEGGFGGLALPVAGIGVAEKGYLTLGLLTRAAGGHSSVPPRNGAIPRLCRALLRLEEQRLPARIDGVVAQTFAALAPHLSLPARLLLAHPRAFAPLLVPRLEKVPAVDAMMRTTTAITMVEAGVKENVLPRTASAIVNFRLLPGDRVREVVDRVRHIVGDPQVEIQVREAREASAVSDPQSDSYRLIARTLAQVVPDAVVAPALVLGGTDSKHYGRIAENSYRFTPFRLGPEDARRVHGVDERIAVPVYAQVIRFYRALLRGSSAGSEEASEDRSGQTSAAVGSGAASARISGGSSRAAAARAAEASARRPDRNRAPAS